MCKKSISYAIIKLKAGVQEEKIGNVDEDDMLLWNDERAAELAAAERNKRRKGKDSIEDSLIV